jgi:hypothetical protein
MGRGPEREAAVTDRVVYGDDGTDVELGTQPATSAGTSTKPSETYGDFRAWEFRLPSGATISGSSSLSMHPKSKGGRWARAILGREPAKGEDITEALDGRPCLISVVEGANGWPKVDEVIAAPAPTAAAAPKASPPPVADDVLPF